MKGAVNTDPRSDDIGETTNRETEPAMNTAAVTALSGEPKIQVPPIDKRLVERQMRRFLAGKTNGDELLHALYDHVLEEPIPQRMRDLLKNRQMTSTTVGCDSGKAEITEGQQ